MEFGVRLPLISFHGDRTRARCSMLKAREAQPRRFESVPLWREEDKARYQKERSPFKVTAEGGHLGQRPGAL